MNEEWMGWMGEWMGSEWGLDGEWMVEWMGEWMESEWGVNGE